MRKLLVLCALCLSASGAWAELVDGVRQRPGVSTTVDFQPEVEYYLFNVGARQFFCGANDWNTRASVSPKGYRVKLVDMGDGTYELTDYVETQSTWKCTFSTADGGAIWVDNSTETYRFWTFNKVGDAYQIANDVKPGMFLGWNGNEGDTRLYFIETATPGTNWQFVTEDVYNAYQEEWALIKDQYEQAAELKTYLDAAKAEGIDVSKWEAVYQNEASSVEELAAALSAVQTAINDHAAGGATVANPSDMTASILNPTFENASYDGWKGTAPNMTGSGAHGPANVAEHYNKTFDTYQDLNGMPKGVYALSANAVFRGSWNDHANHTNYVAYLYAKADGDTLKAEIPNPWDALNTEPMAGSTSWGVDAYEANETHDGVTYYAPNDPSAGRLYFEKGYYQKQVFFALDSDEPVRIGVMKQQKVTDTDWVMFDNFHLTYYGGAPEAYQFWLSEMKKDAADYSEALASKQYKDAYLAAYDVEVSTKAEAVAAMKAIEAAAEAIGINSNLWKQLTELRTQAEAFVVGEYADLDAAYLLADYMDQIDEELINVSDDNRTATNDDLEAAVANIQQLIEDVKTEAKNAMKPGDDATSYMTNPNFDQGTTGWTVVNKGGGNVQSTAGTFEAWHSTNFDVYQEVKGLPVGVYEISVQGYMRYLDGQEAINAKGSTPEDVPIYVYMNDSKTQFANWFDYPQETGFYEAVSGATFLTDNEGYEYPDNTTAAAAAFAKGDYTKSAFGLVAKRGDVLRVGVKGTPATQQFWPCFDNFRLTYRGYAADVVKPVLEEQLAAAAKFGDTPTTKSAKAALSESVEAANTALGGDDGRAMFDALSALTKAISDVEEGSTLCKQLSAAAEELTAIADEYATSAKAGEAKALASELQNMVEASTLDANEIEEYMKQIEQLKLDLQLPEDYQNATDENPANVTAFIKTPGFSKIVDGVETNSIDGWEATGQKFGNSDQLSALALESWESRLDIHQDIEGLPDGIYVLKVNAWQRTSNPTYLFAESGGETFAKEIITQAAGLPEGFSAPNSLIESVSMFDETTYMNELTIRVTDGKLRIGIKKEETSSADWVVMDNFQLVYYGANSSKTVDGDATPVVAAAAAAQPVKVELFTLDGRRATLANKGIVIQRTTLSDGSVVVRKLRQ